MLNKAKIFVISGPSGTGKTTLIKEILKKRDLQKPISYTTRAPRINEINSIDYFFISTEEFEVKINNGDFIEYAKTYDNYYASSLSFIKSSLKKGIFLIKDIDTTGALILKNKLNEKAVLIFIMPPNLEELEHRFNLRNTDDFKTIQKRLKKAKTEIAKSKYYDHIIINDNLQSSVNNVIKVIDEYL